MSGTKETDKMLERLTTLAYDLQAKVGLVKQQTENANNALMEIAAGKTPTGELLSRDELREIADRVIRANSLLAGEV